MPADTGKLVAFFVGGLSFIGCLVTNAYPEWLRNSIQSSPEYLRNDYIFQGIWWRCSSKIGSFTCDQYDVSLLDVPADIQACRALMCIATIFSFFGVIISLLSLDCTRFIEPETKGKNLSAMTAGICYIIAAELQAQRALMVIAVVFSFFGLVVGIISLSCTNMIDNRSKKKSFIGLASGLCFFISALTCGIAVSWFAWKITYEYYSPYFQQAEFKFEFGACLYIGWIATLFGACTLITTIWFGVNVRRQYYDPLHKNDSFKYEFGSCLYVGWVAGPLTLISGLVLLIGSCRKLKDRTDEYKPPKQFVYKPPTNSFVKPSGEKAEYV